MNAFSLPSNLQSLQPNFLGKCCAPVSAAVPSTPTLCTAVLLITTAPQRCHQGHCGLSVAAPGTQNQPSFLELSSSRASQRCLPLWLLLLSLLVLICFLFLKSGGMRCMDSLLSKLWDLPQNITLLKSCAHSTQWQKTSMAKSYFIMKKMVF